MKATRQLPRRAGRAAAGLALQARIEAAVDDDKWRNGIGAISSDITWHGPCRDITQSTAWATAEAN